MKIIVFLSVLSLFTYCIGSGTSSHFTRHNIREQIYRARVFLTVNNLSLVYVFDTSGFFTDCIPQVINTTIFRENNGSYAVLNPSAQACFRTANTYNQFSNDQHRSDTIGLYVDRPVDLL